MNLMSEGHDDLQKAASSYWKRTGAIDNLQRLSAGASAETWTFDFVAADINYPCILRMDAVKPTDSMSLCISKLQEFSVLSVVRRAGVQVPTPYFLFNAGYVMQRLPGESLPRKILRDAGFQNARRLLTRQCAKALAAIHAIPIDGEFGISRDSLPTYSALEQLAALEALYCDFDVALPVFTLAIRWLKENAFANNTTTLVHGDFRNGNLLVDPQGLCGVLDWELAHLGDPAEDLGWLCVNAWRFGNTHLPVGGFGSRAELLDAYAQASGRQISSSQLHYWEVFGTLRWGIICLFQVFSHLRGQQSSVELAAIGRRIPEVEMDLLVLLAPSPTRSQVTHA